MNNVSLVHFDTARRELALATNLDEVKLIRDQAEVLRQYIRQQGATLEMQNQCAEIKIRAERKAGEMLGEQGRKQGQRDETFHDETFEIPKLDELGISRLQSHRWQLEAGVPEEVLEQHIAKTTAEKEELTSAGILRLALKLRRQDRVTDLPPLKGKYRTIVIDPPWDISKILRDTAKNQLEVDFNILSIEEIMALPITEHLSPDGSHIYLWTTQKYLPVAFDVLDAWGLEYVFTMVWHKKGGFQPFGLPQYNCEFVLFAKYRTLPFANTKGFFTCFEGVRREHSRKPDSFYELVKRVSPEPRLDWGSREKRDGFEQYGNEVDKFNVI